MMRKSPYLLFFSLLTACSSGPRFVQHARLSPTAQKGQTLYFSERCHRCHGKDGSGNLFGWFAGSPRDLRRKDGFLNGTRLEQIAQTIKAGIPDTKMPAFSELNEDQRLAIAQFIREGFYSEAETQKITPSSKPEASKSLQAPSQETPSK